VLDIVDRCQRLTGCQRTGRTAGHRSRLLRHLRCGNNVNGLEEELAAATGEAALRGACPGERCQGRRFASGICLQLSGSSLTDADQDRVIAAVVDALD